MPGERKRSQKRKNRDEPTRPSGNGSTPLVSSAGGRWARRSGVWRAIGGRAGTCGCSAARSARASAASPRAAGGRSGWTIPTATASRSSPSTAPTAGAESARVAPTRDPRTSNPEPHRGRRGWVVAVGQRAGACCSAVQQSLCARSSASGSPRQPWPRGEAERGPGGDACPDGTCFGCARRR